MKNLMIFIGSLATIMIFIQCQKDTITTDPPVTTPVTNPVTSDTITVSGDINADISWETGNIYLLDGQVNVLNNATLTIQAGVVVKGISGTNATLVVTKGSKINASGTAEDPIIFTAEADNIQPGEVVSSDGLLTESGLWGGLIILGCAPISDFSLEESVKTQFVPDDLPEFYYGGTVANDNSGTLEYVSIRYAGGALVQDENIPALSLQGVGSGTTINGLEIYTTKDDALALRGGTVNVDNAVIVNTGDDDMDTDLGWSGTMDNIIVKGGPDKDFAIEIDGGKGNANPGFLIRNIACKGNPASEGGYVEIRRNAKFMIENAYFFDFGENSGFELRRSENASNWLSGDIDVTNLEFNTSHLSGGNQTIVDIFIDKTGSDVFSTRPPDASIVTTPGTGADKSAFSAWTAADAVGDLNDF